MRKFILTIVCIIALNSPVWATSWKIDDTYTFTLSVNNAAGAVDADSAPSYRVYEDEAGTAILTGSMALLDDANTTGYYSEQITLSAANGLEKGKSYNIIMCATVSSVTHCATEAFQMEAEVDSNTVSGTPPDSAGVDILETQVGTAGAGLTDLGGMSTGMKAEINTEADTALSDYDPPTRAELTTDKDSIITEVNANEAKIDTVDDFVDTEVAAILADTGTDGVIVATADKNQLGFIKQITATASTTITITDTANLTEASNKAYVGALINCPNDTDTSNRVTVLKIIKFEPASDKITVAGAWANAPDTSNACNIYMSTVR